MDTRRALAVLLLGLGLSALQVCAGATTYKLPVRTATLGVASGNLLDFVNGEPVGPYECEVDPPVLRIGEDSRGWGFESLVIFDWRSLDAIPEGTNVQLALHLTPASAPLRHGQGAWTEMASDHSFPLLSDFDWGCLFGGWVFGFSGVQPAALPFGAYPHTTVRHRDGSTAFPLYPVFGGSMTEIAGSNNNLGLDAPYVLATVVPEPSSVLGLGAAVLSLGALAAGVRKRWVASATVSAVLALMLVAAGQVAAQEGTEMNSEPGYAATAPADSRPDPITRTLPDGFMRLPTMPRLLWSFGCANTTGAMICLYYDLSGFPRLFRYPDGSDAVCSWDRYPSDNYMFLRRDQNGVLLDSAKMYPSRCALSATEMGVFGQESYGHVDDYYYGSPFTDLTGLTTGSTLDPYYLASRTPHADNCIGDYMGTSHSHCRAEGDGLTYLYEYPWGQPYRYVPPTQYPVPCSGISTRVDGTWGLAQYISQKAEYYCKYTSWTYDDPNDYPDLGPQSYGYNDVADFYNLSIAGYRSEGGATPQHIVDEISDGRPVMAIMHEVKGSPTYAEDIGKGHMFPVFGYKWTTENGQQRLKMLAYDTWLEDRDPSSGTSYRIVDFPNMDEIPYRGETTAATGYFTRASNSKRYKIYEFGFLKINNNPRCDAPLADAQQEVDKVHNDEFDLVMTGQGESGRTAFSSCSKVYYSHRDPTPACDYVEVSNGTATLHIDQDCAISFRTYKDGATSTDGYLASRGVRRVFSVFSANKNVKKWADNTEVTMVNGLVTHVVDSDNFYFEERDKRLFGIKVHKANHGLQGRRLNQQAQEIETDEVEVVVGDIQTDANDERYIDATTVTVQEEPADDVRAYGIRGINVGGQDYSPPGGSGTGYGQKGVEDGQGVNDVGLLVRITGLVTDVDVNNDCFTISDGSGAVDSVSNEGVKVSAAALTLPDEDDFVTATGICTLEKVNGYTYPVVLVRDQDDIVVVQ